jgi:hypothetical protein
MFNLLRCPRSLKLAANFLQFPLADLKL